MADDQASDRSPSSDRHHGYESIYQSDEFAGLRRTFRRFVFPTTVAFLVWYFLYVLLANYAHDFMAIKLVGNINVALVLGLLQFVSTFLIAWWYAAKADRDFDPAAARLRAKFEQGAR